LRSAFFDGTPETNGLEIVLLVSKGDERHVGVSPDRMPYSFRPAQIAEVVNTFGMKLKLPVHQAASSTQRAVLVPGRLDE
jgi:hypothetical protein